MWPIILIFQLILNSDGIYLSSYNKSFKALSLKKSNFRIIGSAHNSKRNLYEN